MKFDQLSLQRWKSDNGDNTHIVDYKLTEDSVVIDLGGFLGVWVDVLLKKINPICPRIILVEPVFEFYKQLSEKFKDNNKITIMHCGVSTDSNETEKNLYLSSDGSSTNFNSGNSIKILTLPINEIFLRNNIESVDLMQINIEGDEYSLMEYMVESEFIKNIKNIQIQYHLGIDGDRERRDKINEKLKLLGYKNKFNYPFVWESWTKI